MIGLDALLDEAIKWAIPVAGSGAVGLLAIKRRSIRDWQRRREASRKSIGAMADSWPTVLWQIGDSENRESRITLEFAALNSRMDTQDQALGDLLALNYGQFELTDASTFVCDNAGRNLMVNSAYARLLRTGREELMDFGYRRFVAPSEVAEYLARFRVAADDHREFECDVCLIRSDATEVKVHVRMVPHPRQKGPATHWIGTIAQLEGAC